MPGDEALIVGPVEGGAAGMTDWPKKKQPVGTGFPDIEPPLDWQSSGGFNIKEPCGHLSATPAETGLYRSCSMGHQAH